MPDQERAPLTEKELRHILTSRSFDLIDKLTDDEKQQLGRIKNRMLAKPGPVDPAKAQANVDRLESEEVPETSGSFVGNAKKGLAVMGDVFAPEGGEMRKQLKQDAIMSRAIPVAGVAVGRFLQREKTLRDKDRKELGETALDNYRRRRLRPKGSQTREEIIASRELLRKNPGSDLDAFSLDARFLPGGEVTSKLKDSLGRMGVFAKHVLDGDKDSNLAIASVIAEFGKAWVSSTTETVVRPEQMAAEGRKLEVALNMLDIIPLAKGVTTEAKIIKGGLEARRSAKLAKAVEEARAVARAKAVDDAKKAAEAAKSEALRLQTEASEKASERAAKRLELELARESAENQRKLTEPKETVEEPKKRDFLKEASDANEAEALKARKKQRSEMEQGASESIDGVVDEAVSAGKSDTVAGSKGSSGLQSAAEKMRQTAEDLRVSGEPEMAAKAAKQADELEAGSDKVAESAAKAIDDEIETASDIPAELDQAAAATKLTPEEREKVFAAIDTLEKRFGSATVKAGIESGAIRIAGIKKGRLLSDTELENLRKIREASQEAYDPKTGPKGTHATHAKPFNKQGLEAAARRKAEAEKAAAAKLTEPKPKPKLTEAERVAQQKAFMDVSGLGPEAGKVNKALVATLAAAPFGAVIGSQIAKETDQNVYVGALAGGLGTIALGLVGSNPSRALEIFKDVGKTATQSDKDLGQVAMAFWNKVLPDKLISPGQQARAWASISPTVGVLGGAGLGALDSRDKPGGPLRGALYGGVSGLMGGSVVGAVGRHQALTQANSFNPLRAMRKLLLDAPDSSPNLAAYALDPVHYATRERMIRDGYASGYRFKQGQKAFDSANPNEKAAFKDYLMDRAALDSLPEHLRADAALYKHAWEEVTSALAEVDMNYAKGISELGKFDPKLYAVLRNNDDYELVSRWLAKGVEGQQRLTPKVFEKLKNGHAPPDVKRALERMAKDFELDNPNLVSNFEDLSHQMEVRRFAMYAAAHSDLSRSAKEIAKGALDEAGDIISHTRNSRGVMEAETKSQRFVQLPDSPKYGALRGRYVDSYLAEDMMDAVTVPRKIHDALQPVLSTFKRAKVTWNPATHVRNVIGAFSMTNGTAGVPTFSKVWYHGALDFKNGTEMFKEARDAGVFGRTFVKSDLTEDLVDKLVNRLSVEGSALDNYLGFSKDAGKAVNRGLHKMEDVFELEEEINKMILYRHARTAKNLSPDDAAKFALKFGYDYNMVPGWVRWSKSSIFGSPFITFAYKAMPRAFEAATDIRDPRRALKFWKYPMMMAAVNEISASRTGLLEEQNLDTSAFGRFKRVGLNGLGLGIGQGGFYEDSIYQRFMPDYWGSNQVLLPYRDHDNVLRTFDATYYIGWGDIGEAGKGPIGQNLAKHGIQGFPRAFEPGHPALTSFVAAVSGRDMQTGMPIDNPLSYVASTFAPSWVPQFGRGAQRIERATTAAPGKESVANATMGALGGISTKNFDPHTEWSKSVAAAKSREKDAAAALNRLTRKDSTDAEYGRAAKAKQDATSEVKALEKDEPPKNRVLNRATKKLDREQKRKKNAALRALKRAK